MKKVNDNENKNSQQNKSFVDKVISGEFSAFSKLKKNKKNKKLTSKEMNIFWFLKYVVKGALLIIINLAFAGYFSVLVINKTGSVEGGIGVFIGILVVLSGLNYLFYRLRKKQLEKEK